MTAIGSDFAIVRNLSVCSVARRAFPARLARTPAVRSARRAAARPNGLTTNDVSDRFRPRVRRLTRLKPRTRTDDASPTDTRDATRSGTAQATRTGPAPASAPLDSARGSGARRGRWIAAVERGLLASYAAEHHQPERPHRR